MAIKRKPHHSLTAVQAKFAEVDTMEITRAAVEGGRALGYSMEDIVEAVQALERGDFIKSETAHSPPNSRVWHDTYNMTWPDERGDERWLYLKFAGETLIDVRLTSFKEVAGD